jgi:hypothetical protein
MLQILTQVIESEFLPTSNYFGYCELFRLHKVELLFQVLLHCLLIRVNQRQQCVMITLRCRLYFKSLFLDLLTRPGPYDRILRHLSYLLIDLSESL